MDLLITVDEARRYYARGDAAHDFDHVLRVARLAIQIAQAENADETVVHLAALLHDVPVTDEQVERNEQRLAHHLSAASFAERLLLARGFGTERTANVVHCIEAHRYRDRTIQPQSREAKCLYDADKLDSIGAIGIGRAFAYAGSHGNRLWTEPVSAAAAFKPAGDDYTPVHEYVYKLSRILDTLYTECAREIGRKRHEFMQSFFAALDDEMLGLR